MTRPSDGPPRPSAVRKCQLCGARDAEVDGKTRMGPWADMCAACHKIYGVGLGAGRGSRLGAA